MKQTIQAEIPPPLSANSLAFGLSRSSPCCFGPLSAVRADDITLPNTVAFVGAALIDGTGNALQLEPRDQTVAPVSSAVAARSTRSRAALFASRFACA
jgi:hypothetical protein